MYLLRIPEDFRPEQCGWTVHNPIVPHQQLQAAMAQLHQFGFVSTHYVRAVPGTDVLAVLAYLGYDAATRSYRCMYAPPSEPGEGEIRVGHAWDEIRRPVGQTSGSDEKSPVSF